eukprot:m.158666 g.158666  ORF g.158666 m.158666 type:complete len:173 (-) comp13356_c0_seq6:5523-6041(-)
MRQLSLEAFQSMIETDPIPHVLINACKNKDSVIPFVLESTKIVTEEEWKDELVPEDGCGIVITDSDGVCPIDHLEHGRTIAWFDVRTKAGEEKFELPWKVCEEVIKEGVCVYSVQISLIICISFHHCMCMVVFVTVKKKGVCLCFLSRLIIFIICLLFIFVLRFHVKGIRTM